MSAALELHGAGQLGAAASAYESILSRAPEHAGALSMLGVCHHQQGQHAKALDFLDAALAADPRDPGIHNNRGEVLRALGDCRQALAAFEAALRLDRTFADACINGSFAALECGDLATAERLSARAAELAPRAAEAHMAVAETARSRGDWASALGACERAARYGGERPDVALHLGLARAATGDLAGARASLEHALALAPEAPEPRIALAELALGDGQFERAEQWLQHARRFDPENGHAARLLGRLLLGQERFADAASCLAVAVAAAPEDAALVRDCAWAEAQAGALDSALARLRRCAADAPSGATEDMLGRLAALRGQAEAALRHFVAGATLDPDNASLHAGAGDMFIALGRFSDAETALKRAIALDPSHGAAYESLASIADGGAFDASLTRSLEALTDDDSAEPQARAAGLFALARVRADDFQLYRRANDLLRERYPFDRAQHRRFVDSIIQSFPAAQCPGAKGKGAGGRGAEPGDKARDAREPIFIVGMPRSGTSLAEQILSSHSDVTGAGEVEFFSHLKFTDGAYPQAVAALSEHEVETLAASYLEEVTARAGAGRFMTDKMPANFIYLGLIVRLFPNARIVHCTRDPLDNCVSLYFQNFTAAKAHAYSFDLSDLGAYYREYRRLMQHWRETLTQPVFELNYESLVADQHGVSNQVLEFLGLPWEDAVLRFHESGREVHTASQYQVRQPLYPTSVERWRRFDAYLAPLRDALAGA